MDISALKAFIAVARHQSFSRASEQLFITQPAVSKRVAALEEELGTQLFNRVARQVSLTEAGKHLLSRAQDLVSQADDMQRYASNLSDDISGNLSLAISHHISLHRMPPILKEYNLLYPNVALDIQFEDSDQAFYAVEQGDIEFAVITLPKRLPDTLLAEAIWTDQLHVVVGSEHELAKQPGVEIEQLAQHPAVLSSKDTETYKIIEREFSACGQTINLQMETNNLETLKMLVGAGLGWSLLPKTMASSLHVLDLNLELTRHLGIVLHSKRSLSNAALALKSLIQGADE